MLQLFVNNKELDLGLKISVQLTYENPLFLVDEIPGTFSYSFTLPGSPNNLGILGHPERINSNTLGQEYDCEVRFAGIPFLTGSLKIDKVDINIRAYLKGAKIPDRIRGNLNDLPMEKYELGPNKYFSEEFVDSDHYTTNYKQLIKNSLNQTYPDCNFIAAPIRMKNIDWAFGDKGYGLFNAALQYLSFYNPTFNEFRMDGGDQHHTPVFPIPYLNYVLDVLFDGDLKENPFIDDPELQKLVVVTYSHTKYNDWLIITKIGVLLDYYSDSSNYFRLNSFLQKYPGSNFLKELFKPFGMTLFMGGNAFRIKYKKDVINNPNVIDWSAKLADVPVLSTDPGKDYIYGYTGSDGFSGDVIKANKDTSQEVENVTDILAVNQEGKRYVRNTNQVFEIIKKDKESDSDPDVFYPELTTAGVEGGSGNGYSVISEVAPLPMDITDYWTDGDGVLRDKWYVPAMEADRIDKEGAPRIMFFRGMTTAFAGTDNYPLLSNHNIDHHGNRIGEYSLHWEGPDGLFEKFHKDFALWMSRDKKKLEGKFLLTAKDLLQMDLSSKYYVNGKKFFIKKISIKLDLNQIHLADVTMIEA